MKWMIASDIHGSLDDCIAMQKRFCAEKADKLLLLGDLLYHGPRNPLPPSYNPQGVIALLNEMKDDIRCVRGNCDAEVDQMVLSFPIRADYSTLWLGTRMVFVTHGHLFHTDHMPPLRPGDVLLHGHTHLYAMDEVGQNYYLNPGSISLPKGGNPKTYMVAEDGVFTLKDFSQNVLRTLDLNA